jgi:UDP-glucose:(heptosyl)LPS alpha-1,3-glucosyltransferase
VRIAVIARPYSFHGGVEHATEGLLRGLVERGEEVELLTPGPPPPVSGVGVRHLRVPPLPAAARMLAIAVAARWAVRRGRWDIVQSHERTLDQDIYRAGEGCHRAYLASVERLPRRRVYHAVALALERRLFARTPRIVAIAARGRREIERFYAVPNERLRVVYNGVDLDRFHPRNREVHREATRRAMGVAAPTFVALFIGSGFERKGLAAAIEGLAAMGDASARLLVLGRGSRAPFEMVAERRGVGDRIIWLGPRSDTERWYATADVVVLPTRYEPFGNVHLEALASGLPVVTSELAGGAELIQDGLNGYVVDPFESGAVGRALDQVRTSYSEAMAADARRSAEPFTYALQADGFVRIYRELRAARAEDP